MLKRGLHKLISGSTYLLAAWIAGSSPAMTKKGSNGRKKNKEAERRQTQCFMGRASGHGGAPRTRVRLAPTRPLSGALACRHSTTALAGASERSRSAPVTHFLGRD
jgi:hypothetical protein